MKKKSTEGGWRRFIRLCRQLKTGKQLEEFFDLFLTIEERNAISDRTEIIIELLKGEKTQREIAAQTSSGIATVTRGSNYLKTISANLRKFLENKLM